MFTVAQHALRNLLAAEAFPEDSAWVQDVILERSFLLPNHHRDAAGETAHAQQQQRSCQTDHQDSLSGPGIEQAYCRLVGGTPLGRLKIWGDMSVKDLLLTHFGVHVSLSPAKNVFHICVSSSS